MRYTDKQILDQVESRADGFTGWRKGVYDIWIRSAADIMDAFDDKVYTFYCERKGERPEFRMVCTGTSHAGSYGLKKFHGYNPDGCAVLKSNQIVYGSHRYGRHKNYMAYRQAKSFPYYRDNDYDNKAEEIGEVRSGIIYANCHRAHSRHTSRRIYNWSVACLVRNRPNQFYGWLRYMNKRPLSVCILREF